jgi:shikimate dehydrogenase
VIPLLDDVDSAAQAIGAVNTIVIQEQPDTDKKLVGYNSDWSGFLADLADNDVKVRGRQCLVLGAGGSARAIAYALATSGARVVLFARRLAQAQALIDHLQMRGPGFHLKAADWKARSRIIADGPDDPLIVNCTPLGMVPDIGSSPWPESASFPPGAIVYDLVYRPAETRLIQQARLAGCWTAGGLGMLLHQGAQAFQLWTGADPSLQIMAEAIK